MIKRRDLATVLSTRTTLYYGWVLVLTLSLTELTSWGILYYAFSAIAPAMEADLGWSKVTMTGAFSLALLLSGIAAVPVGRWVDRHGTRVLMTIGSCVAVLLVIVWAYVTTVTGLYAVWVGIGLTTALVLYEPAFALIAVWFRRLRGRALFILTFFGGMASLIFIPTSTWLMRGYGWRTTLLILAGILAIVTIAPHALLLRRHPHDLGLLPDGAPHPVTTVAAEPSTEETSSTLSAALHAAPFWWLALAFAATNLSSVAFTVHLIPYLLERGYDSTFAALATGSFGAMSVLGRVLCVPLGSRMSRQHSTALLFVVQAAGLASLRLVPSAEGVWLAVALFGAGAGALTPARAGLLAEYYGVAAYGRINGVLAFLTTWARAAAPIGAGSIATRMGYAPLWWGLSAVTLLGSGAVMLAGRVQRRSHTAETR